MAFHTAAVVVVLHLLGNDYRFVSDGLISEPAELTRLIGSHLIDIIAVIGTANRITVFDKSISPSDCQLPIDGQCGDKNVLAQVVYGCLTTQAVVTGVGNRHITY